MRKTNATAMSSLAPVSSAETCAEILPQAIFARKVDAERKKRERPRTGSVLMLLECGSIPTKKRRDPVLARVQSTLPGATTDSEIKGWYEDGLSLGVLFTETAPSQGLANAKTLAGKIKKELSSDLTSEELNLIRFSYRIFPKTNILKILIPGSRRRLWRR
jgi:hypothetical protein